MADKAYRGELSAYDLHHTLWQRELYALRDFPCQQNISAVLQLKALIEYMQGTKLESYREHAKSEVLN